MLTISSGHSADYLTGPVAHGRESYYTGAVDAGEPPGRWSGQYAAAHGLVGEVDHQDMSALFKSFIDPADPRFRTAGRLGRSAHARPAATALRRPRAGDRGAARRRAGRDTRAPHRDSAGGRARHATPCRLPRRDVLRPEVDHCRARRVRGAGGRRPDRRRHRRGRCLDGAPARRRGRDLGRQRRGARVPHRPGRLLPGRPPFHRRRPVHRRARLHRRVVLPARQPGPRPAAAHSQRDPEPGAVQRRGMAHPRLPRAPRGTAVAPERSLSGSPRSTSPAPSA